MEKINIYNLANKILEKENQRDYYLTKKEDALKRIMPKSVKLKGIMVDSSLDVTTDKILEYCAEIEEYDVIIEQLTNDLNVLYEFEEKELKRIKQYDCVEQQVIHLRNKGKSWSEIGKMIQRREIPVSLRTARRIWKSYIETNNTVI